MQQNVISNASPRASAMPAIEAGGLGTSAGVLPDAMVNTILARPLFSPNRRPPASGPALRGAAPPALPRVAGILVNGRSRSVIFAAASGGKPVVVVEGAELNGFKVQSIEAGQVTVLGPNGLQVLHPSFDPQAAAPAPTAQPVGQGSGLPGLPGLPAISGLPSLSPPGPFQGTTSR